MKEKNSGRKKAETTPIIDGDARPDQQDQGKDSPTGSTSGKKKVTSNRAADKNSLENFRDGK